MSATAPSPRRPRLPLPRLPVVRVLGKPLILRLLLLLLVIEAVFLAESFTTLMEHALRYGGSTTDVAHLLTFKIPEILDLGLTKQGRTYDGQLVQNRLQPILEVSELIRLSKSQEGET